MPSITNDVHYTAGYADPSPYPALSVQGPDLAAAALLADDYAGTAGELTASLQYIYHHTMWKACPDAAEAVEKISIVEMMHMQKLAQAIVALGGDARFCDSAGAAWQTDEVQYGGSLAEALHQDIASEYAAIRNYQAHIAAIADPGIQALLRRIVLDEQVHLRIFAALLQKYDL